MHLTNKTIEDSIAVNQSRVKVAENLVEDGYKLLKTCLKKMNQGVFLDDQLKVELDQKREKELAIELEKEK